VDNHVKLAPIALYAEWNVQVVLLYTQCCHGHKC